MGYRGGINRFDDLKFHFCPINMIEKTRPLLQEHGRNLNIQLVYQFAVEILLYHAGAPRDSDIFL